MFENQGAMMLDPDKYMARHRMSDQLGANGRPRIVVLPPQGHGDLWNGAPRSAAPRTADGRHV